MKVTQLTLMYGSLYGVYVFCTLIWPDRSRLLSKHKQGIGKTILIHSENLPKTVRCTGRKNINKVSRIQDNLLCKMIKSTVFLLYLCFILIHMLVNVSIWNLLYRKVIHLKRISKFVSWKMWDLRLSCMKCKRDPDLREASHGVV